MKRILVNGFSAKSGGGKVIFENFMSDLPQHLDVEYHVLYPGGAGVDKPGVSVIQLPRIFRNKYFWLFLYLYYLPFYCRSRKISSVLNFGDLILPRIKNQTYFFDWAYLVINDKEVWNGVGLKARMIRKVKVFLIRMFRGNNSRVIVQSDYMGEKYRDVMKFSGEIFVIPTPVSFESYSGGLDQDEVISSDLLYISNYAPHKNFEVIPELAFQLSQLGVNTRILVTLSSDSLEWRALKQHCELLGVGNLVVTLGSLNRGSVFEAIKRSKALFFPSLLESYGIPLVEAMYLNKPIITSDLPFIRSVCDKRATYFNPKDVSHIARTIKLFFDHNMEFVETDSDKISQLGDWRAYSNKLVTVSLGGSI